MTNIEKVDSSKFRVGMYVVSDEHGLCEITGGYYLDPTYHRLSNFFHYKNVVTGEEWAGYGEPMHVPEIIEQVTTFKMPHGGILVAHTN